MNNLTNAELLAQKYAEYRDAGDDPMNARLRLLEREEVSLEDALAAQAMNDETDDSE